MKLSTWDYVAEVITCQAAYLSSLIYTVPATVTGIVTDTFSYTIAATVTVTAIVYLPVKKIL